MTTRIERQTRIFHQMTGADRRLEAAAKRRSFLGRFLKGLLVGVTMAGLAVGALVFATHPKPPAPVKAELAPAPTPKSTPDPTVQRILSTVVDDSIRVIDKVGPGQGNQNPRR